MTQYGKNGFLGSNTPSDAMVLAMTQEHIDSYRLKFNFYEYTEWKLKAAKITLQERQLQRSKHDRNTYDPHLDLRITYTQKVIKSCQAILNEQEET